MIRRSLNDNYKAAVEALDAIPGIGRISAEQILAETSPDMKQEKLFQRTILPAGSPSGQEYGHHDGCPFLAHCGLFCPPRSQI